MSGHQFWSGLFVDVFGKSTWLAAVACDFKLTVYVFPSSGKNMSKYHYNSFEMTHWMFWKRLLKEFMFLKMIFLISRWIEFFIVRSFLFDRFFFFNVRYGGSPLCLRVVLPRCGCPVAVTPTIFFVPRPWRYLSRDLGDSHCIEGLGTWSMKQKLYHRFV